MEPFEIFYYDLDEETQEALIAAGYDPDKENWDVFPIFTLHRAKENSTVSEQNEGEKESQTQPGEAPEDFRTPDENERLRPYLGNPSGNLEFRYEIQIEITPQVLAKTAFEGEEHMIEGAIRELLGHPAPHECSIRITPDTFFNPSSQEIAESIEAIKTFLVEKLNALETEDKVESNKQVSELLQSTKEEIDK